MARLGGLVAAYPRVARLPFALVAAGWVLGLAGLAILSVATFQTQQTGTGSSLAGPVTLTLTWPPVPVALTAFLAAILSIPLVLALFPRLFNLTASIAPAYVALYTAAFVVGSQLVAGLVASSATWAFVGDGLVLWGCALEVAGIVIERVHRARLTARQIRRVRPSQPATPPRA